MTSPLHPEATPPVPPPVFRIGIAGHRPGRLTHVGPDLLSRQIVAVLQAVCAGTQSLSEPTRLVLLTSLAEGADRIAATSALALGFALEVPLPMPTACYEQDFKEPGSVAEFRVLLATAERVFILPAPGKDRASSYAAASNVLLNQCDLLLLVWDGDPAGGVGGAADSRRLAMERGLPIVQIAAEPAAPITFAPWPEALSAITALVARTLAPAGELGRQREEFTHECWPRRFAYGSYTFLRLVADRRLRWPPAPNRDNARCALQDRRLRRYFVWADTLAIAYGERSRTASLRLQILGTVSVVAALLNVVFAANLWASRWLATTEGGALIWLLAGVLHSHRACWHQRWLRYRALAEQLRCADLLVPLGLSAVGSQSDPEHASSNADLMPWLVARIQAEQGLAGVTVDNAYLKAHRQQLESVLAEQAAFHSASARRYAAAERALHRSGIVLFVLAMLLTLYDVVHAWAPHLLSGPFRRWPFLDTDLSALAAILPALGAAAAAIVAQGEYRRLSEQSGNMKRSLERLARTKPSVVTYASSVTDTALAAEVLGNDVRSWSDVLATRPPSLPV